MLSTLGAIYIRHCLYQALYTRANPGGCIALRLISSWLTSDALGLSWAAKGTNGWTVGLPGHPCQLPSFSFLQILQWEVGRQPKYGNSLHQLLSEGPNCPELSKMKEWPPFHISNLYEARCWEGSCNGHSKTSQTSESCSYWTNWTETPADRLWGSNVRKGMTVMVTILHKRCSPHPLWQHSKHTVHALSGTAVSHMDFTCFPCSPTSRTLFSQTETVPIKHQLPTWPQPGPHHATSCLYDSDSPGTSHKWNHTVFVFCLFHLT